MHLNALHSPLYVCVFFFYVCFVQKKKVTALEDIDITVEDDKVCATKNDISQVKASKQEQPAM